MPKQNVLMVTEANVDTFLTEKPAVPKVLLFSEKPRPNLLYNALSNNFHKKLEFGFVTKE